MCETIATARLTLRRFRPDDAAAFHAIFSDPDAMRYWSTPPHATLDQTESWIARTIAATRAGVADEFVIELAGRVIGKVGLWRPHELGLILAPGDWGHGYAREAAAAVLARAFARGVPAVTADVDPRNVRSLRLLRSLGFVQTRTAAATCKVGDEWVDSVYLELRNPARPGELPASRRI